MVSLPKLLLHVILDVTVTTSPEAVAVIGVPFAEFSVLIERAIWDAARLLLLVPTAVWTPISLPVQSLSPVTKVNS